ncbi:unnamed protein product, partial [Closterium sp. NIES-54]
MGAETSGACQGQEEDADVNRNHKCEQYGRKRTERRRETKNLLKERNEVRPLPCSDSRTSRDTSARVLRTSSSSNARLHSTSSSTSSRVRSTSSSSNARVRSTSSSSNARVLSTSSSTSARVCSTSRSSNARVHSTRNSSVSSTSSTTSSSGVRNTRRSTPKSAAPLVPLADLLTGGELPARRRSTSTRP